MIRVDSVCPQRATWPRGKILGGSSNLDHMLYARCHPNDYDQWADVMGDLDWSYKNLLPYFKKSLDHKGAYGSNSKHDGQSASGNLHVESRPWKPMHHEFMATTKELSDALGENVSAGFTAFEVSRKNGYPCGRFPTFIGPVLDRQNLYISRYSHATKVLSVHFTILSN